jgi:hypothetical protein
MRRGLAIFQHRMQRSMCLRFHAAESASRRIKLLRVQPSFKSRKARPQKPTGSCGRHQRDSKREPNRRYIAVDRLRPHTRAARMQAARPSADASPFPAIFEKGGSSLRRLVAALALPSRRVPAAGNSLGRLDGLWSRWRRRRHLACLRARLFIVSRPNFRGFISQLWRNTNDLLLAAKALQ